MQLYAISLFCDFASTEIIQTKPCYPRTSERTMIRARIRRANRFKSKCTVICFVSICLKSHGRYGTKINKREIRTGRHTDHFPSHCARLRRERCMVIIIYCGPNRVFLRSDGGLQAVHGSTDQSARPPSRRESRVMGEKTPVVKHRFRRHKRRPGDGTRR